MSNCCLGKRQAKLRNLASCMARKGIQLIGPKHRNSIRIRPSRASARIRHGCRLEQAVPGSFKSAAGRKNERAALKLLFTGRHACADCRVQLLHAFEPAAITC